jgi:hypothetical protein
MRIVIEDGDALTIESRRAGMAAELGGAIDGGGAPTELLRRFGLAPEEEPEAQEPAEPALNPLRAGAAQAEAQLREGGGAPESLGEPER